MAVGHGDYAPPEPLRGPVWTRHRHRPDAAVGRPAGRGHRQRFLIAHRLLGLQPQPRSRLQPGVAADREREFVTGYFGEASVPAQLLWTYEVRSCWTSGPLSPSGVVVAATGWSPQASGWPVHTSPGRLVDCWTWHSARTARPGVPPT